jgi:hypothetical protein
MREDNRLLRVSALTGMVNENYTGFEVLISIRGGGEGRYSVTDDASDKESSESAWM